MRKDETRSTLRLVVLLCLSFSRSAYRRLLRNGAEAVAGLQENLAGLLCYALWWVSGLVFFLIDKRPSVRFHAMQSIILFGGVSVLQWIFPWGGWFGDIISLAAFVCWILCMVKAYQGQRFKLPVIGDLAESFSK